MDTDNMTLFPDRTYAAFLLEQPLHKYHDSDAVIMAIPRGGVTLGYHLSKLLNLPLDLQMAKKIGHPMNKEYAIGSVTLNDVIINEEVQGIPEKYIREEAKKIQLELAARYNKFRSGKKPISVTGKNVILVDDGVATGYTMLACVNNIRKQNPAKVIIAVPVASRSAFMRLNELVDQVVCLSIPTHFQAVGQFYQNFHEVTDDDVIQMLNNELATAVTR